MLGPKACCCCNVPTRHPHDRQCSQCNAQFYDCQAFAPFATCRWLFCQTCRGAPFPALLASLCTTNHWLTVLPSDLLQGRLLPMLYWNNPPPPCLVVRQIAQPAFVPHCFVCACYCRTLPEIRSCEGCRMLYIVCAECTSKPPVCVFCKNIHGS